MRIIFHRENNLKKNYQENFISKPHAKIKFIYKNLKAIKIFREKSICISYRKLKAFIETFIKKLKFQKYKFLASFALEKQLETFLMICLIPKSINFDLLLDIFCHRKILLEHRKERERKIFYSVTSHDPSQ